MTGYDFASKLARELSVSELSTAEADMILAAAGAAARKSERLAAPLACYLLGLANVSPTSAETYVNRID